MPVIDGQVVGDLPANEPGGPVYMRIPPYAPPASADAELARRAAEFRAVPSAAADAKSAGARLAGLSESPEWRGKFFDGDVETRREFQRLTELVAGADVGADAVAGTVTSFLIETTTDGQLSSRDAAAVASDLLNAGLSEKTVEQILTGSGTVTKAERAATLAHQRMRLSDGEWTKRYLAGGWVEQREATLHVAILACEVEG